MTLYPEEKNNSFSKNGLIYLQQLQNCFTPRIFEAVETLAKELRDAWLDGRHVFICGNGGSAANAMHMANDFHYGIGACGQGPKLPGLRVEALSPNTAIVTCLANDIGYEKIYSHQIEVKGRHDDLLIVLSGSGNSPNVIKALETANALKLKTFAIVAFSGGKCRNIAQVPIHFDINDMQIAEDTQLIVGHLCMQWLSANKPEKFRTLN